MTKSGCSAFALIVYLLGRIIIPCHATYTCPTGPNKPCKCSKTFRSVNCNNAGLTDVPPNIPDPVETLNLAGNSMSIIHANAFGNLKNLLNLDMRRSKLWEIETGAFKGLENLRVLYLTGNSLKNLNASVCNDLKSLTKVYLGQNRLQEIPNLGGCRSLDSLVLEDQGDALKSPKFPSGFLNLTMLKSIVIGNNNFGQISSQDFAALKNSKITKIALSRAKLQHVEKGSFEPVSKTLVSLKIGYNDLNATDIRNIGDDIGKGKQFSSFNFDGVKLGGNLPPDTFRGFSQVSLLMLSFRWNSINILRSGTFTSLRKLRRLDMSYCQIQQVEAGALTGLDMLESLLLHKNEILAVPHSLPKTLVEIDLESNQIQKLQDSTFVGLKKLHVLNLKNNIIQKLSQNSFAGLENLRYLNLSENQIDGAGVQTFSMLRKLRSLSLQKNRLTKIVNNPRIFEKLVSLEYLDMSDNGCSVLPMDVFLNLRSLKTLKLERNELGPLLENDKDGALFAGLDGLEKLSLEQNSIKDLTSVVFRHLQNLKTLSLGQNSISHWGGDAFSGQDALQHLNLSRNSIATINKTSMSDLNNLTTLTLTSNPFSCDCALVWFRRWINQTSVQLPQLEKYRCISPQSMQGVPLLNFNPDSLLCIDLFPYILGGSLGGAVVLFLVLSLVMYRYRWFIRLRAYRVAQAVKKVAHAPGYEPIPGDDLHFDAYISNFREVDRRFILDVLLPNFDSGDGYQGEFRLCFEERDHEPGEYVIKNVEDNIKQSQRGLIILSLPYLNDGFKMMELHLLIQEANQRAFGLIVVVMEDIPPNRVPGGLRLVFQNDDCLTWSEDPHEQELFKQRLRNKLQRRPVPMADAVAQAQDQA